MTVYLKPGSDKQIRRRHPWVFSGAIHRMEGQPTGGSIVRVCDHGGDHLGWGFFSPTSQIRVRMTTSNNRPDDAWLEHSIFEAVQRRRNLIEEGSGALRLVFSEADGIPGLIADLLGTALVLQSDTAGGDTLLEKAAKLLEKALAPWIEIERILEKSDGDGRTMEGLSPRLRFLKGDGNTFSFRENGILYTGTSGQKTGHYCDLREARLRLRPFCRGKRVLDGFCHTGGMGLNALAAEAQAVWFVDQSKEALDLALANAAANGFDRNRISFFPGDVFQVLRQFQREGRRFDLVILDPPKLAPRREHRERALRAYKDLALQGLRLLDMGGLLALFSCSGAISRDDLVTAAAFAAWDLGTAAYLVDEFRQSSCHPVPLTFPQAHYLNGILVQKGGSFQ